MKFLGIIFFGLEMRIYTVPAANREDAHRRLYQLLRVRAYCTQSWALQRPLFIQVVPMPHDDQINQVYVSHF